MLICMNLQSYTFCWNCPDQCLKHVLESSLYAMLQSFSSASAMEQNSVSSKPIEEHRVATDGLAYTKQEFLDYYGAEVGENLWCASEGGQAYCYQCQIPMGISIAVVKPRGYATNIEECNFL